MKKKTTFKEKNKNKPLLNAGSRSITLVRTEDGHYGLWSWAPFSLDGVMWDTRGEAIDAFCNWYNKQSTTYQIMNNSLLREDIKERAFTMAGKKLKPERAY